MDATTGNATSWDPNAGNTVRTLAVSGSTVYAGGSFRSVGGQTRNGIAALDATTGNATSWDPSASSTVRTLVVSDDGSTVYTEGQFTSIGGQTRNRIAALDATTGNAASWNPDVNSGAVNTLVVSGSTVYAGGDFDNLGGQPRRSIAQFLTPAPEVTISFTTIAFGNVELADAPASLSSVVDSVGELDLLTTSTLTNDGGGAFALTSVPVSPLAPGTSSTLELAFAPSDLGLTTGMVTLATNDPSSPTIIIALSGTGVDTQTPTSTVTGPSGNVTQASANFNVTYTANDSGSGVASVELFFQRNGGSYVSYGVFTSSPINFDTGTTGGDGTYDFYTIATDVAGNTESKSPTNETTVTFNNNTYVGEWSILND